MSFDDSDWGNPDGPHVNNYSKSKILAEKASWHFVKSLKGLNTLLTLYTVSIFRFFSDGNRFAFTTILPAFITGPTMVNERGTSTLVSG
jgi:hypothetical protein